MEWVETTGVTDELAIQEALEALGIEYRDAEVVIVSSAKKGIFGIASKQARVRVRIKPQSLPQKKQYKKRNSYANRDERRPYKNTASQSGNQTLANQQKSANSANNPTGETAKDKSTQFNRQKKYRSNQTNTVESLNNETAKPNKPTTASQTSRPQRYKTDAKPVVEASNTLQKEVNDMDIEEKAKLATSFLQELLTKFDFDAKVEVSINSPQILINIDGPELGILVGPKGSTLDAIQEITRTIIQRNEGIEERTKLIIDVSRYRQKRANALATFVQKIGQEVIETGVTKKLEPMNSPDRKVVHDTISSIEGLKTRSEGFEPRRRVVVYKATDAVDSEVFSK